MDISSVFLGSVTTTAVAMVGTAVVEMVCVGVLVVVELEALPLEVSSTTLVGKLEVCVSADVVASLALSVVFVQNDSMVAVVVSC